MRIEIENDNQNILDWGTRVLTWIRVPQTRPHTVEQLNTQLDKNNVKAKVDGPDSRLVEFWNYSDKDTPLRVALPSEGMLNARLNTVDHGQYPLPHFYDIAFGGATRAQLSRAESLDFAARRI